MTCVRPLGCERQKTLLIRGNKTIALFTLSFTLLTGTALISYVTYHRISRGCCLERRVGMDMEQVSRGILPKAWV